MNSINGIKHNDYNKRVQAVKLENTFTWYLLKIVGGKNAVIQMLGLKYYVCLFFFSNAQY